MFDTIRPALRGELDELRDAGLYKEERVITTPQAAHIATNQEIGRAHV